MVSLESYSIQAQIFKGVAKLQELGFGIYASALQTRRNPGMPDLCGAVTPIEIDQPCRSDDTVLCFEDGDPWNLTGGLRSEGRLDPCLKFASVPDSDEHVPPDAVFKGNLLKAAEVIPGEWFQPEGFTV
nr:hypothetical protein [Edaphobacter modestus]